ncbi:probable 4-coumarate--CoA ligase 3 [Cherax quadricarinatus]
MRTLTFSLLFPVRARSMGFAHTCNTGAAHARTVGAAHARTITTKHKSKSKASELPSSETSESLRYVVESQHPKVPMPYTPFAQYIFSEIHKWSHKTAIECGITGRRYTYGKLLDGVMRFGGMLQQLIRDNSEVSDPTKLIVAILSPNSPEYPVVFMGTLAVSAVATTINPTYTPGELGACFFHSPTDLPVQVPVTDSGMPLIPSPSLVLSSSSLSTTKAEPRLICRLRHILPELERRPLDDLLSFLPQIPSETIACMPYSSGTTGKPKGVCIPHSSLSNIIPIYHNPYTFTVIKADGEHQEEFMGLLPFFHIYGMMTVMSCAMFNGVKLITLPRFEPKSFLEVLKKNRVSCLHVVPPLLQFIASSPVVSAADLDSIHTVICGAAPSYPSAVTMLKEKVSRPIFFQEGYGLTELLCTHLTPKDEEKLGSCGKLLPNMSAKIIDLDTNVALPPGAKGELYIKTPVMMSHYHNNPQQTADTIDADGWFRTGDIASYQEDGNFIISDRIKEVIKVKGMQVSPSELEDVILGHPNVADVGIVGVEDERAGEVPRAYVVRHGQVTEQQLHDFMESRVAPYKQLAGGIKFVEGLPKNSTGKLLRKELKKKAEQK